MNNAELILNADGSIYHLGLHREQLADTIITVGDPERVEQVSRHFDQVEYRVQRREFVTHTGRIGAQRLTVLSTGIGTDNIDIVLNELDALVNIDLQRRQPLAQHTSLQLVRIGTTGGLQPDIPVDSFVCSTGAFGLDGLLHFYQAEPYTQHAAVAALRAHCGARWQFPLAPYFVPANADWAKAFDTGFEEGITLTNPGFYGPQGRQLRAPVALQGYLDMFLDFEHEGQRIVNLEMETSAIFGLSGLLGHRAASLSVVLANRAKGTFSNDPQAAVGRLIELVLANIHSYLCTHS